MIIPEPLNPGDSVALVAPASPVSEEKLKLALESIKFLGLDPHPYPGCFSRDGYLAGSDDIRAKDINDAFADSCIKGIFCLRGGYGSIRILPLLDYKLISRNPKFFAGYSDITALHTVFNKLCSFVTYHSPMPSIGYNSLDIYTMESLSNAIFQNKPRGVALNPSEETIEIICPGEASGQIIGGNLSVMASVLGSTYDIDGEGKILFMEEVGEPLYKIDRNLTALKLAGKFDNLAGIIVGVFSEIREKNDAKIKAMSLRQFLIDFFEPLKIPAIANFRSGHIYPQITIPLGMDTTLNAIDGEVTFHY